MPSFDESKAVTRRCHTYPDGISQPGEVYLEARSVLECLLRRVGSQELEEGRLWARNRMRNIEYRRIPGPGGWF